MACERATTTKPISLNKPVMRSEKSDLYETILRSLRGRTTFIGVISLRDVELPIVPAFTAARMGVLGLDIDSEKPTTILDLRTSLQQFAAERLFVSTTANMPRFIPA